MFCFVFQSLPLHNSTSGERGVIYINYLISIEAPVALESLSSGNIWRGKCKVQNVECMPHSDHWGGSFPGRIWSFKFQIFPRCQKLLSLKKQQETHRKIKVSVGKKSCSVVHSKESENVRTMPGRRED